MAVLFIGCSGMHSHGISAPSVNKSDVQDSPNRLSLGAAPFGKIAVPFFLVTSDWKPNTVKLICRRGGCPEQLGVLVFAAPKLNNMYDVHRCTAFLVDHDKILSNGHCDYSSTATGYFIMRTDSGEPVVRRITQVLKKVFTPGPKSPEGKELASGRQDIAMFQLDSTIPGITPLALASDESTGAISELIGFVINDRIPLAPYLTNFDLAIDEIHCRVHRHEAEFPYELSEQPDVILSFDCNSVEGNSGSPMFAPGSWAVEAILQGGLDGRDEALSIRKKYRREPHAYEIHSSVISTNIRCLNLLMEPKLGCVTANEAETSRRFVAKQIAEIDGLRDHILPNMSGYLTKFSALRFQLVTPAEDITQEFEVFYTPTCRFSEKVPQTIIYPIDHVKMTFDEWAKPQFLDLAVAHSVGNIRQRQGEDLQLDIKWSPRFGEFVSGTIDPRLQLGNRFWVALPPCAR